MKSELGYKGVEKKVVEENGGKIILLEDITGVSTTEIIKRICNAHNPDRSVNKSWLDGLIEYMFPSKFFPE